MQQKTAQNGDVHEGIVWKISISERVKTSVYFRNNKNQGREPVKQLLPLVFLVGNRSATLRAIARYNNLSLDPSLIDAAGQKSPIDHEHLSSDERSGVRGEIHRGANDLFGLAKPAHRGSHQKLLTSRRVVQQIGVERGAEDSRSDGIHQH